MLLLEPSFFTLSPLSKKITLKEFFKLEKNQNGEIKELIDGVIYMSPMPVWGHANAALAVEKLQTSLAEYLSNNKIGKFFQPRAGIIRDNKNTWLEPDLFFLSNENLKKFKKTNPTTADLVIEVLSISKWEKIIIYELGDNLESRTFPKIKINLNKFFLTD